ncbi:phosphoribosyltransferase family protein [Actinocatenispora thailandica]|uniref:phosphoribosyltransferase family protein n=1 Tax=Actinocatenispora thailandica TaxID=227318 RepID=UPI0031E00504
MFRDRGAAGEMLVHRLTQLCLAESVVLGVAAGGVAVGYPVARRLGVPLDVVVVHRLRAPDSPHATLGAATEDRIVVGDRPPIDGIRRAHAAIDRQARRFHQRHAPVPLADRTAVVVDDGVMTGATARAACLLARRRGARRVVFAAPVMPIRAIADLSDVADDLPRIVTAPSVPVLSPWYASFPTLDDEDVVDLLDRFDAKLANSS